MTVFWLKKGEFEITEGIPKMPKYQLLSNSLFAQFHISLLWAQADVIYKFD